MKSITVAVSMITLIEAHLVDEMFNGRLVTNKQVVLSLNVIQQYLGVIKRVYKSCQIFIDHFAEFDQRFVPLKK